MWFALVAFFGIALVLMRLFSADIYDAVITHRLTTPWYRAVLEALPEGANVLDIGIGTAVALVNNKTILQAKNISVVGIDYDAPYIAKAANVVTKAGLCDNVHVHCMSVYDKPLPKPLQPNAKAYDAVYFSGSISLMPDPAAALKAGAAMLTDKGKIYITQTFQKKAIPFMQYIKPLAYYVTTIDFGQLTYEQDIRDIVAKAGMEIGEYTELKNSVQTEYQTARMMVINPK